VAPPVRVSSVVLCYNSARHIERCVASLLHDPSSAHDEVFLVDNGSTDGTRAILERLRRADSRISTILNDSNRGTTAPRNEGLSRAAGSYLAIVDSDAELTPGAMDRLVARHQRETRAGIVVPRLVYPDGRMQLSTDVFPSVGRKLHRALGLRAIEAAATDDRSVHDVDYAISACWLLSREVVEAVGPLDEAIFYSPEDVDYCIRVWQAGYRVVYDGSITAVHHAQEISRGLRIGWATWSHVGGLAYLYRKHRFAIGRRRLYRRIGRFAAT
jgi:GT2 family glycosyltransferase